MQCGIYLHLGGCKPQGATVNNSATGDYNSTDVANVVNAETLGSLVVQTSLDKSGVPVSLLFPRYGRS